MMVSYVATVVEHSCTLYTIQWQCKVHWHQSSSCAVDIKKFLPFFVLLCMQLLQSKLVLYHPTFSLNW